MTIQDLEFRYSQGDFCLVISEFSMGQSEKMAITGPSVSGKTALLNLISGITLSCKGEIKLSNPVINPP